MSQRGPVSLYEMLPTPLAIPPLYHEAWQYPPTDTPPSTASTALPSTHSPFTGPYHNSNVDVNPPSIPASTSTHEDGAQRLVNDICKTSPFPCGGSFHHYHTACGSVYSLGRDKDTDKRDVKGRRAPQTIGESVSSSAETASNGLSSSLSQSSPTRASVTGFPTSPVSSSISAATTLPVPGSSVSSTPPTFTSTATVTPFTTTVFPSTSSALASPSTPANGLTSPTPTLTPSPTTGTTITTTTTTTTMSDSPGHRSLSTTTTRSRATYSSATSISVSLPTFSSSSSPSTLPSTTSTSDLPTSSTFTTPPSASIYSSSTTTSDSITVTNITSFTPSSLTFTSSFIITTFTPSSSISASSSDPTSNLPLLLTQSSTYTFSSSITNRVFTTTSTKVYTSTLSDGSKTVVTTIVESGVLSTNTSLSGNRFSGNTGAVIAVAVCATVGVIVFVFVLFFLCKRYRESKERQRRRKRRPGLRLPAVPFSGPGTGNSGGSGGVGDSSANILGTGYGADWSRSRSGEAVMEAGPSEDGDDEEDVWRSPLVGEDDDIGMGMGGVGLTTPPESAEGRPVGGGKSSIGHQSGHSHAHSQSSSAQGLPPSMAEFGMGPVSYTAYAYPPALVSYIAAGGGREGSGGPGGAEGQTGGLDSHGSRISYGPSVPYGLNGPFIPYPVSGVGIGCHVPPAVDAEETKDKPEQRPNSGRQESEGGVSSTAGGHAAAISASATTVAITGASGLVSMATTSGSRGTSGSKGSIRSIGSKNLRGFMDRIRTSVPNIQVIDGVLPTRRGSKDTTPPSSSGGEMRPGYDYGAVGRPRRVSGIQAPPPVAFVPGFHIAPPGADVPNNLPSNPQVDISNHYHGPILYGYPVPVVNGEGVDEDDDSLRIASGVVTNGLLDPNLSLVGDGGSFGGRSSPNVEGVSLRDYVDYSRRIGGMVKNHVTRSTTTFDTVDQDGSIHFFANGGGTPTPG